MGGLEHGVIRFTLAAMRFAPALIVPALTPFGWVPLFVRLAVLMAAGLFATALAPTVPAPEGIDQPIAFGAALLGEGAFGLTLALAVVMPGAAIGFSARVVDIQSGVAAISLFNPASRAPEAMTGSVMQWVVTLTFFALGLHLLLLKGMLASTQLVPLGTGGVAMAPERFLALLGSQFVLGLAVVVPVILGLFAVDIGVAFASRSMPQVNVYFVALPLKVAAAFLLLAATLRFAPQLVGRAFADAFQSVAASVSP